MDLRHLQTLCAVIDSGGFTRAAERLYLTQSAVSFQIRQLEDALGTTLFDRSAGGVRPTQSGEVLYRYARKLLLLAAEARDENSTLESARQGRVRIGATEVCALFLPEVLRQFGQHHANVEIAVFEGPAAQVVERVLAGQSDIGIVPFLDDVSGIAFTPLLELQLLAVCEPRHAFSQLEVVTAAQLAAQPLALYEQGSVYRQVVERACASIGMRPRIAFESNWLTSLLRAVEAGLGVTVLPLQSVREQVESGRLVTRPLAGVDARLPIAVAARSRETFSVPLRDLIDLLVEQTQRPGVHLLH
ncbi:MAG: LysR family transcriptional regulator [Chloroflexi bacterium]|nr:LysR family transcriptional regulator [Chloroflexota bacterium]MBV9133995.1 LysR family transcriptional regulator [Chloroflexota bacterium]